MPNFVSTVLVELLRLWPIQKTHSFPYHPQINPECDRANRSVLASLKPLLNEAHLNAWELSLPQVGRHIKQAFPRPPAILPSSSNTTWTRARPER